MLTHKRDISHYRPTTKGQGPPRKQKRVKCERGKKQRCEVEHCCITAPAAVSTCTGSERNWTLPSSSCVVGVWPGRVTGEGDPEAAHSLLSAGILQKEEKIFSLD